MTETILKIAALIAFAGAIIGFLLAMPELGDFVIGLVRSLVILAKQLDTIFPVHEELDFIAFGAKCLVALWSIELLLGLIKKATSSGK